MPRGLTTEEFTAKARETHGERYSYSKTLYKNYLTPVVIGCHIHGDFEQKPNNHLFGAECPTCSRKEVSRKLSLTRDGFIKRATERFGDRYTYERTVFVNSKTPVIITCKKHGPFTASPNAFLTGHSNCSTCSGSKLSSESFIERAKLTHGERYEYSRSLVAGYHGIVTITCKEHGDFEQTPNNHLQGKGCSKCAGRDVSDTASFVESAKKIHGNLFDYSEVVYTTSWKKVSIICKKHGAFVQAPANHLGGNGCSKCVSKVSKPEIELFEFVKTIEPNVLQSVRSIISPFELDIVLPDKMIAIEYNGLYFHSDRLEGRKDNSHRDKMNAANAAGYRLIQVWEDDWLNKRAVVEKTIRHILGVTEGKVGARSCAIEKCGIAETREFFNENHLQGSPRRGGAYVLKLDGVVVAAMAFSPVASERGKLANSEDFELVRYAATSNVIGGASRLMSAFLKDTPECKSIISYSDNDWFTGGMYKMLGFEKVADVEPDYRVVDGRQRRHKTNYKLAELAKRFGDKFNPLLSERENCRNNGLYRVYNSGLKKWRWVLLRR